MAGFTASQIKSKALVEGTNRSRVEFLQSETVAKKVADNVWAYLSRNGYSNRRRENLVRVRPSASRKGTWKVEVLLPGVTYSRLVRGGKELDDRQRATGMAALRASYGPNDLVTSWPLK